MNLIEQVEKLEEMSKESFRDNKINFKTMSNPNLNDELGIAHARFLEEVDNVSNCCGAKTTEPDVDNLARCLDCKEGCVVEPEIPFEEWLEMQRDPYEEHKDAEIKQLNSK